VKASFDSAVCTTVEGIVNKGIDIIKAKCSNADEQAISVAYMRAAYYNLMSQKCKKDAIRTPVQVIAYSGKAKNDQFKYSL